MYHRSMDRHTSAIAQDYQTRMVSKGFVFSRAAIVSYMTQYSDDTLISYMCGYSFHRYANRAFKSPREYALFSNIQIFVAHVEPDVNHTTVFLPLKARISLYTDH